MNKKIHCYSCGRDTETSEVRQFSEKSILRCKDCLSINFKVLEDVDSPTAKQSVPVEDGKLQEA